MSATKVIAIIEKICYSIIYFPESLLNRNNLVRIAELGFKIVFILQSWVGEPRASHMWGKYSTTAQYSQSFHKILELVRYKHYWGELKKILLKFYLLEDKFKRSIL
jgi:hypothetical protein